MSDDWDAPVASVHTAVVNQWDGEDEADDQDAPDAWDAEPEEVKPASSSSALALPEKKKAITKRALQKKEEEDRKLAERLAKAQIDDPNYGQLERERLKKLEEDRDAALAGDLFGMEALKPKEASSNLPGSTKSASSTSAVTNTSVETAATPISADPSTVVANHLLKAGARIEDLVLDTDADVDRFVTDLGKRLEKLGKSALASKKIGKIIAALTEETVKLGVLRLDDVGELKRVMTVKHNEMTTKLKKGDKKGANKPAAAKPVVALARNAFMHGDNFGSHADENPDDYDFI